MQSLGIYISVPFCKAKCTFCNFASDVFAPGRMGAYTNRLCREIAVSHNRSTDLGASLPHTIDTIYFGGGTPSLLEPCHIAGLFGQLRANFQIVPDAEITLECAPGQLTEATLDEFLREGVNRVSLGVQSFVDGECAAVGRLHTRAMCLAEIDRLRAAGLHNLNVDLIAGLPLQTEASWRSSVKQAIATGVPHVSVYMLEIDEESRLGREALAHGTRYGAGQLPTDDQSAEFYQIACDLLKAAGIPQYEISNFARPGHRSRHNLKYWRREPYLGFGLDAHSMLRTVEGAVRFANPDDLDLYLQEADDPFGLRGAWPPAQTVSEDAPFEEALFLGLRLNEGVSVKELRAEHGDASMRRAELEFEELRRAGLVYVEGDRVSLTDHGRLVSNEVFERLLVS